MTIKRADETPGACKRRAESVLAKRVCTRAEVTLAHDVLALVSRIYDLEHDLDKAQRQAITAEDALDNASVGGE